MWTDDEICAMLINAAFKVHTTLGPGLLESSYEKCLAYEVRKQGVEVIRM